MTLTQLGRRLQVHTDVGELVVGAVQFSQLGVFTYIQTGELVVVTVQIGQLSILAHIKVGKIPAVAVQLFQIREIFNAGQVADVSCTVENDSGYFFPLGLAENAIFVIINSLLPQILTEVFIREVGRVNGDIARFIRLRGAGFRSGQGRSLASRSICSYYFFLPFGFFLFFFFLTE